MIIYLGSITHVTSDRALTNFAYAVSCVYFVIGAARDEDPVGSGDFWPAGSGSGTFFDGFGFDLYLRKYKIIFITNKI